MRIVGLESKISCVRDRVIPLDHRDTGNRADPYTEPKSCFSDSSDSLNSLNSVKVPLHLEKTPVSQFVSWVGVSADSGANCN